jgi:hypothetical protein
MLDTWPEWVESSKLRILRAAFLLAASVGGLFISLSLSDRSRPGSRIASLAFWGSSSEFRWAVPGRAVKVAGTLGLDKIKAFGKFIHVYGPSVRLRKPGCAGLSAIWAPKLFNPTLDYDHLSNMSAWVIAQSVTYPGTSSPL